MSSRLPRPRRQRASDRKRPRRPTHAGTTTTRSGPIVSESFHLLIPEIVARAAADESVAVADRGAGRAATAVLHALTVTCWVATAGRGARRRRRGPSARRVDTSTFGHLHADALFGLRREELTGLGARREHAHRADRRTACADQIDDDATDSKPAARHRLRVDDDVRALGRRGAELHAGLLLDAAAPAQHRGGVGAGSGVGRAGAAVGVERLIERFTAETSAGEHHGPPHPKDPDKRALKSGSATHAEDPKPTGRPRAKFSAASQNGSKVG
jgi:hypothetical protein